jgi:outer membrane receptor protein involved in Fe transport
MKHITALRGALCVGVSIGALLAAAPVVAQEAKPAPAGAGNTTTIGEVIVTAQRRSESIQSVPIAVSAFSGETLKQQRLNSGGDLILQVPNVTFSRGNYGGFNFQIRGIGTKLVATSADAAIGVHENYIPLSANTLGDTDFYDTQRIEVLRGPQGTQFGRNSTGGLVNIITNTPTDHYEGSLTAEYGNFNTKKVSGFVNMPLGGDVEARVAAAYLNRDGFGHNDVTGHAIDGRDLYSTRATLAWRPTDNFKSTFMWEHFSEADNREQVGKQLCITDNGPATIGGVSTGGPSGNQYNFSQGCKPGNLHSSAALGEVNSAATLGGGLGVATGLITGNAYAGEHQDPNLRNISSRFDPMYHHNNDLFSFNLDWHPTDHLELTSTTSYSTDSFLSIQDYNQATPTGTFNPNVTTICNTPAVGFPPGVGAYFGCNDTYNITDANGTFVDPQVGSVNYFATTSVTTDESQQFAQEIRLQSSFSGPLNFSVGASYLRYHLVTNYYVNSNTLTAAVEGIFNPLATGITYPNAFTGTLCPATGALNRPDCQYVDPSAMPTGAGHNYFDSRNAYTLQSYAAFGEVYYNFTHDLKLTAGFRFTEDDKRVIANNPALFTPGSGPGTPIEGVQSVTFREPTGRVNLDWTPSLPFTNKSLFYASYSRGYKGGGFNPPQTPGQERFPKTYAPEFIDAFEIGSKNTLLDGKLVLDGDFFYYNYSGYQISEIIQRTSVNVNINAKIYGAELQAIWTPIHNLTFNTNIGYLHTQLDPTSTLDLTNLTQSDPSLQTVKNGNTFANCIAPVSQLATLQAELLANGLQKLLPGGSGYGPGVCGGGFETAGSGGNAILSSLSLPTVIVTDSPGVPAHVGGNQLPNSPNWTVSVGVQYKWETGPWIVVPRADFYYQSASYSRIFNAVNDRLNSYTNTNLAVDIARPDWGMDLQLYVKNLFNTVVVTDQYVTDDSSGLFTNIFLNEPRTYGVSLTKKF